MSEYCILSLRSMSHAVTSFFFYQKEKFGNVYIMYMGGGQTPPKT